MTFGISFLAISEPFHAGYILAGIDRWYAFLSDARAILRWIYPSWYFVSFSCRYFFFVWGTYRSSLWFFDVFIYVIFVLITSIMMVAAWMTKVSCTVDIFVFYVPFHEWLEFL